MCSLSRWDGSSTINKSQKESYKDILKLILWFPFRAVMTGRIGCINRNGIWALVAVSYLENRDGRDCSSRAAWPNSLRIFISEIRRAKQTPAGVSQG
jgi:hypothetical protein